MIQHTLALLGLTSNQTSLFFQWHLSSMMLFFVVSHNDNAPLSTSTVTTIIVDKSSIYDIVSNWGFEEMQYLPLILISTLNL